MYAGQASIFNPAYRLTTAKALVQVMRSGEYIKREMLRECVDNRDGCQSPMWLPAILGCHVGQSSAWIWSECFWIDAIIGNGKRAIRMNSDAYPTT